MVSLVFASGFYMRFWQYTRWLQQISVLTFIIAVLWNLPLTFIAAHPTRAADVSPVFAEILS
jgi:hypothetical protein